MDLRFSWYLKCQEAARSRIENSFENQFGASKRHVQLIAYCIMPTHIHLVLKQLSEKGIEIFMAKLLNSYARYFNLRHKRRGPLWAGHFKNVLVENQEQLEHLTRYVHLNPVTAGLVNAASDWEFSSHREYTAIEKSETFSEICDFKNLIGMSPNYYERFVNDHSENQKWLAIAKKLALHTLEV